MGTIHSNQTLAVVFVDANGTVLGFGTIDAHGVVVRDDTTNLVSVAPSTAGKVLKSDGTDWTSAALLSASGEIAALSAKTTIVAADVVMIEDSAATNAKKKVAYSVLNPSAVIDTEASDQTITANNHTLVANLEATIVLAETRVCSIMFAVNVAVASGTTYFDLYDNGGPGVGTRLFRGWRALGANDCITGCVPVSLAAGTHAITMYLYNAGVNIVTQGAALTDGALRLAIHS